jgi:signal transduction histidine kinase/ligand-binding sensor domain-containing protein
MTGVRLCLVAAILCAVFADGFAQRAARPPALVPGEKIVLQERMRAYEYEQYTAEQGLPSDRVETIMQDRMGFIWFGTPSGLARFDGYEYKIFRNDPSDSTTIVDDYVMSLYEDKRGRIWVSSLDRGLSCLDTRSGKSTRYLTQSRNGDRWVGTVRQLLEDHEGVLWACTGDGLYRMRPGEKSFSHLDLPSANGANNSSYFVRSMIEDAEGRLWFGHSLGGVDCIDRERKVRREYREVPGRPFGPGIGILRRVHTDSRGVSWFISDDGVRIYRPGTDDFQLVVFRSGSGVPFSISRAVSCTEDMQGNIWIGSMSMGLFVIDPGLRSYVHVRHRPGDPMSAPSNEVLTSCFVRNLPPSRRLGPASSGTMWVGASRAGLIKYTTGAKIFSTIDLGAVSGGNDYGTILSMLQTPDGDLLLSTTTQRLLRIDSTFQRIGEIENPTGNIVYSMHVDGDGALWLVTRTSIAVRRRGASSFVFVKPVDAANKRSVITDFSGLTSIMDQRGKLWVGTYDGMRKYDPSTNIVTPGVLPEDYSVTSHLPTVRAAQFDRAGRLWIGYQAAGVLIYNPSNPSAKALTLRHMPGNPNSLSSDKVYSIFEDSRGGKWIGTANGLNLYDETTRKCTRYFRPPLDIPTFIYSITEDRQGFLWLRSNTGLLRFDRRTGTFRKFGRIDGYSLRGIMSLLRLRSGEMLVAGQNQIAVFNPDNIAPPTYPPRVQITSILFGTSPAAPPTHIPALRRLRCDADQNSISFTFSALSYSDQGRNQYAYMLEGFDMSWTYCGDRRYASYTHLPPGSYLFRVRAANHEDVWNERGASLRIHIDRPFWKQNWFILSTVVLLAGMTVWGVRRRMAGLRRERKLRNEFTELLIRAQEGERERIASELHDGVGQSLLILKNHALYSLQRLQDIRPQLEQISAIASQTIEDVRRISRNLHPYQLERLGMTKALRALADRVEQAGISVTMDIDDIDHRFDSDRALMIYRIVQEAFSNTIRHSLASEARLTIRILDDRTELTIEDDGRGFDSDLAHKGDGGLGLHSIHERIRILRGSVGITSRPAEGTRIHIIIPEET